MANLEMVPRKPPVIAYHPPPARRFQTLAQVRLDIARNEAATWLCNLTKLSLSQEHRGKDFVTWVELSEEEQEFFLREVDFVMQHIFRADGEVA